MRRTANDTKQHRLKTMHRPQRAQVLQQVEAASEAASPGQPVNFWRTQATRASEREREALKLAADYQAKNEALRAELSSIKDKLYNILK